MWSFWKTCMPAGVGSKVNDKWLLVSMALGRHAGAHVFNNLIFRSSETGFRACFRMGRASSWQLIHLCQNTPEAATIFQQSDGGRPPRPIFHLVSLQESWQIFSSLPQIDDSTSSSVSPHPDRRKLHLFHFVARHPHISSLMLSFLCANVII